METTEINSFTSLPAQQREDPISRQRSWFSNRDAESINSGAPSLARTVTRTVAEIWKAVQDDNQQADKEIGDGKDLNKLLEYKFDVGDAIRMETNLEEEEDNEETERAELRKTTTNATSKLRTKGSDLSLIHI